MLYGKFQRWVFIALTIVLLAACNNGANSRKSVGLPDFFSSNKPLAQLTAPCRAISSSDHEKDLWVFTGENDEKNIIATAVASLQGIVNREEPILWQASEGMMTMLLEELKKEGWQLHQSNSLSELLTIFSDFIAGVILYDHQNDSLNIATSLAGVKGAVVLDYRYASLARDARLPILIDVSELSSAEAYAAHLNDFSPNLLIEQRVKAPSGNLSYQLRDFGIMHRALTIYPQNSHQRRFAQIRAMNKLPLVMGWGGEEYPWIEAVSSAGGIAVPANFFKNLSALSCLPVTLPTPPSLPPITLKGNERVIALVMTDGDNISWYGSDFIDDPRFWASPLRGSIPLTWELSPLLHHLAPRIVRYLFQNAKPGESFISSSSGLGYVFANRQPLLRELAEQTAQHMAHSGISVASVMNNEGSYTHAYPFLEQAAIKGALLKEFDPYHKYRGKIWFHKGKPIVSYKTILWENMGKTSDPRLNEMVTEPGIVKVISSMANDPFHDLSSFAVIGIHAWSFAKQGGPLPVVKRMLEQLPANTVVVSADELIRLLTLHHRKPS